MFIFNVFFILYENFKMGQESIIFSRIITKHWECQKFVKMFVLNTIFSRIAVLEVLDKKNNNDYKINIEDWIFS